MQQPPGDPFGIGRGSGAQSLGPAGEVRVSLVRLLKFGPDTVRRGRGLERQGITAGRLPDRRRDDPLTYERRGDGQPGLGRRQRHPDTAAGRQRFGPLQDPAGDVLVAPGIGAQQRVRLVAGLPAGPDKLPGERLNPGQARCVGNEIPQIARPGRADPFVLVVRHRRGGALRLGEQHQVVEAGGEVAAEPDGLGLADAVFSPEPVDLHLDRAEHLPNGACLMTGIRHQAQRAREQAEAVLLRRCRHIVPVLAFRARVDICRAHVADLPDLAGRPLADAEVPHRLHADAFAARIDHDDNLGGRRVFQPVSDVDRHEQRGQPAGPHDGVGWDDVVLGIEMQTMTAEGDQEFIACLGAQDKFLETNREIRSIDGLARVADHLDLVSGNVEHMPQGLEVARDKRQGWYLLISINRDSGEECPALRHDSAA